MIDQTSLQERESLVRFDKQLVDLYRMLRRDPASPTIETLAAGILDAQRGKLIYKDQPETGVGWRQHYAAHGGVAWGKVAQLIGLDAATRKALRNVLDNLAAVAYGADTSGEKRENAEQLRKFLERYGE